MPASRHSQHVTLLLVAISTALIQVALDGRQPGVGLGLLGVSLGLAVGVGVLARRRGWTDWNAGAVAAALVVALLPLPWDGVSRSVLGVGQPYEVQLASVLRNAMFALAAMARLPRAPQQATLASFFLVVFGFLWSSGPVSVVLLVIYSVVGAWWLLAVYWDHLGGRFADRSERSIPIRPAVTSIALLGLLALVALPLVNNSAATTALAGFFPSSGGTQWNDPFANGGVGDGDQMVAAKDQASSFGPIQSELFLESQMPSLYDAFNEFAEARPAKKKRVRRAIPLAPTQMQQNHQRRGLSQQATREFSTVRRTAKQTPETRDRLSAALLLVKGRTPQHLALETYDHWDGRSLIAAEQGEPLAAALGAADAAGKRWLDLAVTRPKPTFTSPASSQVRVINLKTNRVPTPAGAERVTLDGLHSGSMFKLDDNALAMDVEQIPQLTILEFNSLLRERGAAPRLHHASGEGGDGADGEERVVEKLAREWTRDIPTGWPQVEAVVDRLKRDYAHDPSAMVPDSADDAVAYFLTESKRGPDYLFAASTAVMLRSLGYETRVRSGFYARTDRYERVAKATRVLAEDAHFWVEVLSDRGYRLKPGGESLSGVWVTLEPTPGFEVLYAPETILARLARHAVAFGKVLLAHPLTAGVTLLAVGLVHINRRRLLDAAVLTWWWLRSRNRESGRLARLTLRLFEWRAWAYRQRRPLGTTLGNWEILRPHDDFVGLASWALYGDAAAAPLTAEAARATCRKTICAPLRSAARLPISRTDAPTRSIESQP